MSSPLSSLKKSQKPYLPGGGGQRPIPFRTPGYTDDESRLLDEITTGMASTRLRSRDPFVGGLPKIESHASVQGSSSTRSSPRGFVQEHHGHLGATPSDHELLSLMMSRVAQLESKVQNQSRELAEKEKKVRILNDKLSIFHKTQGGDNSAEKNQQLEKKCLLLQQQVHEMEAFLTDYGMVWVGEKCDPNSDVYLEERDSSGSSEEELWRPGSSVSRQPTVHIDFDRLIENVRDLNVLAGDGVAKIQRTVDGARLKIPDPVSLTLYANGMVMYSGPFRPYSDPETQTCIKDLLDGYFPSELQNRYPDGIPFKISDMRKVSFDNSRHRTLFGGVGQTLGGTTQPSRLVPSNLDKTTQYRGHSSDTSVSLSGSGEVISQLPGPRLSIEQFLNKLPANVVKQGRVIDIRSTLGNQLQDGGASSYSKQSGVIVVETPVTTDMKKRLESEENTPAPSSRNVTTLRIKSETGEQTFIVKLNFSDTVRDLRVHLDKQRRGVSRDYNIMSAYPNKTYDDYSLTLEEYGLTPNAVLHLRSNKRS